MRRPYQSHCTNINRQLYRDKVRSAVVLVGSGIVLVQLAIGLCPGITVDQCFNKEDRLFYQPEETLIGSCAGTKSDRQLYRYDSRSYRMASSTVTYIYIYIKQEK